ncbi:hypothetical protein [Thalassoroseus pseudoceratinae]|uniref:hypothetical protein n=1 Tax=Thalassoroseus pseudoceratinae TaxID=2713176 RepID=UPI0014245A5D|nr:hypothetical protein [Thalassoroseus pseudoceratinae]
MSFMVAYLSRGRLLVQSPGESAREVESLFARQTQERRERQRQARGWQESSGLWGNMAMEENPLEAMAANVAVRRPIRFSSLAPGHDSGDVFYLLDLHGVNGLFRYNAARDEETRLMHRNDFPARDLAYHAASKSLAFSLPREDGSVGIVVGENDGRFLRDITLGDSLDESAQWVPGEKRRLVFQSAGFLRDHLGYPRGMSPYRIEQADLESETFEVLLEESDSDLLHPRVTDDGDLYFIRRPYRFQGPQRRKLGTTLKDIVLYPVRFLIGMHHFFSFVTTAFGGPPLISSGGPKRQQTPEARFIMLSGQAIDLHKLQQKSTPDSPAGLVPNDWQLVCRKPNGDETVLAEGVVHYDLNSAGEILVTNGSVIRKISADGKTDRIATDQLIERVAFVPVTNDEH